MFSKKLAALVAGSLMVSTTAANAQAAPVPMQESVAQGGESELLGGGGGLWVALIGAALLAAFILVVIDEEDDDLPSSP